MGNKKDLEKDRSISSIRGNDKAKKLKMNNFVEVSAKTKENLFETFKDFYMEIYRKNKKKLLERRDKNMHTFEIYKNEKDDSKCCNV